jgi:hypothetical protein
MGRGKRPFRCPKATAPGPGTTAARFKTPRTSSPFESGPGAPSGLPASAPGPLTITDGTPAPVITTPADGSDLNTHSISMGGTAEAGSTISIDDGSTTVGTATTDGPETGPRP